MIPLLLHHANRTVKSDAFYRVKDHLLRNCEVLGYDIQHIQGKKCYSCNGTGIYHKYYHGMWHDEQCWDCVGGWFKRPMWIMLERKRFGRYIFHRPIDRKYVEQNPYRLPSGMTPGMINGYVDHNYTRYGYLAVLILFLIYDRTAAKKYFYDMGFGWRSYWWWPMNWLYVCAHFYRHRMNAYPIRNLRAWWKRVEQSYTQGVENRDEVYHDDQLPF